MDEFEKGPFENKGDPREQKKDDKKRPAKEEKPEREARSDKNKDLDTPDKNGGSSPKSKESKVPEAPKESKRSVKEGPGDYYEILGVDSNSTPEEIRKASERFIKENAKVLRVGDPDDPNFKRVLEAIEVLNDAGRRTKYDQKNSGSAVGGVKKDAKVASPVAGVVYSSEKDSRERRPDPDPRRILFENVPLNSPEEKLAFERELSVSVLNSLGHDFRGEIRSIYEDIHKEETSPEGAFLFDIIQKRLTELVGNKLEFVDSTGNKRPPTPEEKKMIREGLVNARAILIRTADASHMFDSLKDQIAKVQALHDYRRAMIVVVDLASNPEGLRDVETRLLNRSSADLGGISEAYVHGVAFRMQAHYSKAQMEIAEDRMNKMKGKPEFGDRKSQWEAAKAKYEKDLDTANTIGWGKPREELTLWARQELEGVKRPTQKAETGNRSSGDQQGEPVQVDMKEMVDAINKMQEEITRTLSALTAAELRNANLQQQLIELNVRSNELASQGGLRGFIQIEKIKGKLSPEHFDQMMPAWFRELGLTKDRNGNLVIDEKLRDREQAMIRCRIAMSYQASIFRDAGMTDLDATQQLTGLRIEKSALNDLWVHMPGFREAVATILNDTMEKTHKVGGKDVQRKHFVISKKGYELLANQAAYDNYKALITENLEKHFKDRRDEFMERYGNQGFTKEEIVKEMAAAAVAAADNMLLSFGVFASADEQRKIMGEGGIVPEQLRVLYQPGLKALKKRNSDETFGGPLGEWLRDNVNSGRMTLEEADRFLPSRLWFSGLEMLPVEKPILVSDEDDKTGTKMKVIGKETRGLGQIMLDCLQEPSVIDNKEFKIIKIGIDGAERVGQIVDFGSGDEKLNILGVKGTELNGTLAVDGSDAVSFLKHLTAGDPKARLSPDKLVNCVLTIQRNHMTMKRGVPGRDGAPESPFENGLITEDLLLSAIAMAVSPEKGLVKGTKEFVPDLGNSQEIDIAVTRVLREERLFIGLDKTIRDDVRKRLFKRLKSRDLDKFWQYMVFAFVPPDAFFLGSAWEKAEAKKRRKKMLENLEGYEEGKPTGDEIKGFTRQTV